MLSEILRSVVFYPWQFSLESHPPGKSLISFICLGRTFPLYWSSRQYWAAAHLLHSPGQSVHCHYFVIKVPVRQCREMFYKCSPPSQFPNKSVFQERVYFVSQLSEQTILWMFYTHQYQSLSEESFVIYIVCFIRNLLK